MNQQMPTDVLNFYVSLFSKMAAKNKLTREGFYDLIKFTYDHLPVTPDGSSWENICKFHKVEPIYANDGLDESVIRKLADAMWLSLDQQLKFEISQQKKLDHPE